MPLGLCVVGCGQFARTFAQAVQPLRDTLDLFFASRDLARARAYAAQFQGQGAFGSYAAAAADPRVEALYVCTPHHLHLAHATLAAQAGKHLLVEKPLARTLAEGQAILAAAERAGVTLMVAENVRFHIPSLLVVTLYTFHNSLAVSTFYPHCISSASET
jgi:predicted dehydrogenase